MLRVCQEIARMERLSVRTHHALSRRRLSRAIEEPRLAPLDEIAQLDLFQYEVREVTFAPLGVVVGW